MSGLILVEQGDGIPLVLQIVDGNTGLYPQAVITDDSGAIQATINLTHVANGLYQNVWTMTDDPYVNATYIVYTTNYGVDESTIYQRDVDTYLLIIPSEYKANLTTLETAAVDIQAKTDNLPNGIKKGELISKFGFEMLTTDGLLFSGAVSGFISQDGGAFIALTDSPTYINYGFYEVDISAAETNCDTISLAFTGVGARQTGIEILTN